MPTDQHGMTHAGAIGLFDDDDERDAVTERSERHERKRLDAKIRQRERRADRQERKETKATNQEAKGRPKPLRAPSWIENLFGRRKDLTPKPAAKRRVGNTDEDQSDQSDMSIRVTTEYVVVRRPPTPQPEYTADDIDPTESPWLRECGMVRVKSDDGGGYHIVPKNSIQKSN
jgi:hypothetical protein